MCAGHDGRKNARPQAGPAREYRTHGGLCFQIPHPAGPPQPADRKCTPCVPPHSVPRRSLPRSLHPRRSRQVKAHTPHAMRRIALQSPHNLWRKGHASFPAIVPQPARLQMQGLRPRAPQTPSMGAPLAFPRTPRAIRSPALPRASFVRLSTPTTSPASRGAPRFPAYPRFRAFAR